MLGSAGVQTCYRVDGSLTDCQRILTHPYIHLWWDPQQQQRKETPNIIQKRRRRRRKDWKKKRNQFSHHQKNVIHDSFSVQKEPERRKIIFVAIGQRWTIPAPPRAPGKSAMNWTDESAMQMSQRPRWSSVAEFLKETNSTVGSVGKTGNGGPMNNPSQENEPANQLMFMAPINSKENHLIDS